MRHEVALIEWDESYISSPGKCSMPVPHSYLRHWQRWGAKLGIMLKKIPIHKDESGEGKTGRVNASESASEASSIRVVGSMDNKTTRGRQMTVSWREPCGNTTTPEERGHPPQSQLKSVERENPHEVVRHEVARIE